MRAEQVGVETPERAAAVRATRLLAPGTQASFDRVARLASMMLDTSLVSVTVLDEHSTVVKGTSGPRQAPAGGSVSRPARETACQLVVDSGEVVIVPDAAVDPRLRDLPAVRELGVRSWIGLPLRGSGGHVLGVLCAMDVRPRTWTELEVAQMRELAALLESTMTLQVAGDDLRSYVEQSEDLAVTLQEALLPLQLPRVEGVQLAARFAAGGTGAEVLGDFYDVLLRDGGFSVVVGDVCGKGPAAARTTSLVRSAVRTAGHTETDAAAVLRAVNDVLGEWFGARRSFVTAAYAVFTRRDAGRWSVELSSAGHPPGFLRRADGTVTELEAGGRVLGITPDAPCSQETFVLHPGDALVLYTDGVTEARNLASGQLDEHGVARSLAQAPYGAGAEQLAAALVDAAHTHAGHHNDDDIAVVAVHIDSL